MNLKAWIHVNVSSKLISIYQMKNLPVIDINSSIEFSNESPILTEKNIIQLYNNEKSLHEENYISQIC